VFVPTAASIVVVETLFKSVLEAEEEVTPRVLEIKNERNIFFFFFF
jgi:hypothetical protein